MSEPFLWIKVVHILSSTVLFGTGLGTAFHMWMAHRSGDVRTIATVSKNVVVADYLFTVPAVIVQPVTGAMLIWLTGTDPLALWLIVTYGLYVLAGACWLPVVWLQIRMRDLARASLETQSDLPAAYHTYMRAWFLLGWPAFLAVIAIFALMVGKPNL